MKGNDRQYLQRLLETNNVQLNRLKDELRSSPVENLIVSDISGTAAYDIYRVRSASNIDHGNKVEGYDDLLPRLKLARNHRIRVLWLVLHRVGFRIFIDLETSGVLGVLTGCSKGPD